MSRRRMTRPIKEPVEHLQTWVPRSLHAWVRREAKRRGLTVAGWLRSHIIELKRAAR